MFLIIDDDPTFNRILTRTLERRGFEVAQAHSADEALEKARISPPKRIILDLNLAGASGLNLIKPLLEISPSATILVLTGYASIATAVDAIKLGATQYLAKPVEIEAILKAFENTVIKAENVVSPLPDTPLSVDRLTWEHIQRVLAEHEGNISATARALNMHRRTLQRKLLKRPVKQ